MLARERGRLARPSSRRSRTCRCPATPMPRRWTLSMTWMACSSAMLKIDSQHPDHELHGRVVVVVEQDLDRAAAPRPSPALSATRGLFELGSRRQHRGLFNAESREIEDEGARMQRESSRAARCLPLRPASTHPPSVRPSFPRRLRLGRPDARPRDQAGRSLDPRSATSSARRRSSSRSGGGVTFRYSQYLNAVLQFFFGGIFSALFIFYFLSSSGLGGYLVRRSGSRRC